MKYTHGLFGVIRALDLSRRTDRTKDEDAIVESFRKVVLGSVIVFLLSCLWIIGGLYLWRGLNTETFLIGKREGSVILVQDPPMEIPYDPAWEIESGNTAYIEYSKDGTVLDVLDTAAYRVHQDKESLWLILIVLSGAAVAGGGIWYVQKRWGKDYQKIHRLPERPAGR